MDAVVHHQPAPVRFLRDRHGVIVGRLKPQNSTGRIVARDRHGALVGVYDPKVNTTRDASGRLVGTGDLLPVMLLR